MSNTTQLFCLIYGDDPSQNAFPVKVERASTVGGLKELIKVKKVPEFDNFAADKLELWKVNISIDKLGTLDRNFNIDDYAIGEKLSPLRKIDKIFPDEPADEHIHIIAEKPNIITERPNVSQQGIFFFFSLIYMALYLLDESCNKIHIFISSR